MHCARRRAWSSVKSPSTKGEIVGCCEPANKTATSGVKVAHHHLGLDFDHDAGRWPRMVAGDFSGAGFAKRTRCCGAGFTQMLDWGKLSIR